jgi:hypothetical protein
MLAGVVLLALVAPTSLPPGYSCEDIRRFVAEHGRAASIVWAMEHGITLRQIYLIQRECKI